jgi:hypothetical protein
MDAKVLSGTRVECMAQINARGSETVVSLEYGIDGIDFPNSIQFGTNATGFQTILASKVLENLGHGITYQYCFRAISISGTTLGPVASFSTRTEPIALVTPANEIASLSARFNGTV